MKYRLGDVVEFKCDEGKRWFGVITGMTVTLAGTQYGVTCGDDTFDTEEEAIVQKFYQGRKKKEAIVTDEQH